jgi:hypothetical protein
MSISSSRGKTYQERPCPGLENAALKPYRHWELASELTGDQLLTYLSGNRLIQELSNFASIKMSLETPDTRFIESRKFLGEATRLAGGSEWVVVPWIYGQLHISEMGAVH